MMNLAAVLLCPADPILYKTWLALKMSLAANSSRFTCPPEVVCSENATLSYKNTTAVLASTPTYHLTVAFSSSDPALSQPVNSSSEFAGVSCHHPGHGSVTRPPSTTLASITMCQLHATSA